MYRVLAALFVLSAAGCAGQSVQLPADGPKARGTVVLLHGYGRRPSSMGEIAERLAASGYRVCNLGYRSMHDGPAVLVTKLEEEIDACAGPEGSVDLVTHSFGGILARALARRAPPGRYRRAVLLAPPNQGSELSDFIGSSRLLSALFGPVVAELGTGPGSLPNRLGSASFAAGVIAGTRSVHPLGTFILDGPNDGTVTVASARFAGMRDFATVHRAHSFIMNAPEVIGEVEAFLADGCFSGQLEAVAYEEQGGCGRFRAAAAGSTPAR